MDANEKKGDAQLSFDERRLRLEERRLDLDSSFARKWLSTLATLMVGVIAGMFSYAQQQNAIEETKRTRIESKARDKREYGFKVIELYLNRRELFDLTKNPEAAELNLRALAAVAPAAVQAVLNAERSQIPPPGASTQIAVNERIDSLAAVAGVQDALAAAERPEDRPPEAGLKPSDFTVYVQYAAGDRAVAEKAQAALTGMGYRVPGLDEVDRVPSRLQVRYYRPEQKSLAGELATELGKTLGLPASSDNAIPVTSRKKKLPGGILEVWLAARVPS